MGMMTEALSRTQLDELVRNLEFYFNQDAKGAKRKIAFALVIYPFGEGKRGATFVSNGMKVKQLITVLEEMESNADATSSASQHP
jgi:hypothetical protein